MMRKRAVCFESAVLIFLFSSVSLTFVSPKSTFYCPTLFGLIIRKKTDRSNFSLRFHIRLLLPVWAKTMLYQVLEVLRNLSRSFSNFLLSETEVISCLVNLCYRVAAYVDITEMKLN